MLSANWHTIRLVTHILGASIWVGGQLTMVYLLPTVRSLGDEATRAVARRFNALAWFGFALLFGSGIWALLVIGVTDRSTEYHMTLWLKLLVVALSGAGAAVHSLARSRVLLAAGGALGLLGALAAVFLGVLLRG